MAYQVLQGIKISPKGHYNLSRFAKNINSAGEWPTSFAFNGWIYNASCDIGYSSQPTEIKLSIVLEVIDREQKYAFFDIKDEDLKCDAGDGGLENLYDIDFNGIKLTDFILYQYDISIENNAKTLNVVFKDYSMILDKIYVGLIKRQGKKFVYTLPANFSFTVICPDCLLSGDSIQALGEATRDLSFGSYAGINGKIYDNFASVPKTGHIYRQWEELFKQAEEKIKFDLNGGYLMLGTEEISEERCGNLTNITYNFNELLASLRIRGLKFEGVFPRSIKDADYIYRQNYIGTLREVLQQWCSDLGYDFYCQGKTFIGLNLNRAINIQNALDVADPTTTFGADFALNQNTAILSFKSSSSLNNTFKQSVITENIRARQAKVHSKTPKRYVGFLPLHPIDFNRHSNALVFRSDAFGTWFPDIAWANNFDLTSSDRLKTLPELDGRNFSDIDISVALTHYDPILRDIYCQDRALYGETEAIRAANFAALGMVPLLELDGEDKSLVISEVVPHALAGDEVSNLCLDKRFYRVFVGYFYGGFKEDIVSWEQLAGASMYKYGIVTQGLLNKYPYMPRNLVQDLSPTEGFYGENGISLLRITHSVSPSATQYYQLRMAPFKDLILYSGLQTPISENLPIDVFNNKTGILPEGLFYGELTNEWGTPVEEFKRLISLQLDDPCAREFSQYSNIIESQARIPIKIQDWKLESFKPNVSPDIEKFVSAVGFNLKILQQEALLEKTINTYYDFQYKLMQSCSKLHVLVLTDTRTHPNIKISFTPKGTEFINSVMLQQYIDREREARIRREEIKTPSICDLSLLQEMCRSLLSGQLQNGSTGDARYRCIIDEDKFNYLTEGFPWSYLTQPNSRGLNLQIIKNPIRNNDTDKLLQTFRNSDIDGNTYYSDLLSDQLSYSSAEVNFNLVYPISTNALGGYRGVLQSNVDLEFRSPEINDIYGAPTNETNNPAASIKVINNSVDPDLPPQLDPYSMRFLSYLTVITGASQILTTVEEYHNFIKKLNQYELTTPSKSVELSLAGTPSSFGTFQQMLSPASGLNKLSLSVADNGTTTNLSFADRPKILPKQESILNKIITRIK